jgi:hypothetical protein
MTFGFQKLIIIMEIKGNKIIKNVKTSWMSMLEPLKQNLVKYKPLFGIVQVDFSSIQTTKVYNSKLFFLFSKFSSCLCS